MIVWGGTVGPPYSPSGRFNDGGRYNPMTDTWTSVATNAAPSLRVYHTAIWTGSDMIVWGGKGANSQAVNDGGRYDPAADSWSIVSPIQAPVARFSHSAVWTGSEMIVWGGKPGIDVGLQDGGRYNAISNIWRIVTTSGAPDARANHTAVWTGTEMIIWGGDIGGIGIVMNTGGRFDPQAKTWTPLAVSGAPTAREYHAAVWTGSEMIIWGGDYRDYDISLSSVSNDTWSYIPVVPNLTLARTETNTLVVTWTDVSQAWRLQSTGNLSTNAAAWSELPYASNDTGCWFIEPAPSTNLFYRLRKP